MRAKPTMTSKTTRRVIAVVAALAALGSLLSLQLSGALATPPAPAAAKAPAAAQPVTANQVRIEITTTPPAGAIVSWGNERLGRTTAREPLVIVRPRDSGPLDLMVRANGFLPVQTRANTFEDSKLQVKLTRPSQKSTLVGYRAPLDAGVPLVTDGGVPLGFGGIGGVGGVGGSAPVAPAPIAPAPVVPPVATTPPAQPPVTPPAQPPATAP